MPNSHFTEEFKIDAVKQITERGYSVAEVSERLGVSSHSLYAWKKRYGKPSLLVDNHLNRQFEVEAPDMVWVTDITYIKTQEGFAYLSVVIDLFSRKVVGWSFASATSN